MELQEIKLRAKQARQTASEASSSTSTISLKRPMDDASQTTTKRIRAGESVPATASGAASPKTPDQLTVPADPNYSGGSAESKDEENTKMLLKQFVMNVLNFLDDQFTTINWHRGPHGVTLVHTYTPFRSMLMVSQRDTSRVNYSY